METKKILIIGPAWVGDMVMAQTLFKLIKTREPNTIIDVLAPDWTRALLSRMPEVHEAISLPIAHGQFGLFRRIKIARQLRKKGYDETIVLPNSWKSALVPFLAGIKKRVGWKGESRYGLLNDTRVLDEQKYPLMIERFMALGLSKSEILEKPYPMPELIVDQTSLQAALKKYHLNTEKPILAICPGAEFGPSKRWPTEYFSIVANQKLLQGYQVWLFGSKNDLSMAEEIQKQTDGRAVNLAGLTSLDEAIDLLSLVNMVVSNDSGLMHIACALKKPLIALYGSSSPTFTPPLSSSVRILNLNLPCGPCFKRECPLAHWRCMLDLKPIMVLDAIKQFETA